MKMRWMLVAVLSAGLLSGCEKKDESKGGEAAKGEKVEKPAAKPEAKTPEAKPEAKAPAAKPAEARIAADKPKVKTVEAKAEAKPEAKKAEAKPTETKAAVGQAAPDFTLKGLDGKAWKLSEQKGKIVVLEWFNPDCPFVKQAHGTGELKTTASEMMEKGVVWVAINSGAPGKQGHGKAANEAGVQKFGLTHPVLLDEKGEVGRMFRATRTPHVMVIDANGVLAYRGGIDNTGGGDTEDAPNGQVINYVKKAVGELQAGKPVSTSETSAWGCSVKYQI